jgi:hypothetical protein
MVMEVATSSRNGSSVSSEQGRTEPDSTAGHIEFGRVDEHLLQDGEWQQQQGCGGSGGDEEHDPGRGGVARRGGMFPRGAVRHAQRRPPPKTRAAHTQPFHGREGFIGHGLRRLGCGRGRRLVTGSCELRETKGLFARFLLFLASTPRRGRKTVRLERFPHGQGRAF